MNLTDDGSPMPTVLEAIVTLPFDLYLKKDCLGGSYEIHIGPIMAKLTLPRLAEATNGELRVIPPYSVSQPPGIYRQFVESVDTERWGRPYRPRRLEMTIQDYESLPRVDSYPVLVRRILLTVDLALGEAGDIVELSKPIANQIAASIEPILANLKDWVEVATSGFILPNFSECSLPPESLGFWSFDGANTQPVSHVRDFVVARSDSDASLDRDAWLRVLQRVSNQARPPVEHIFLKEAFASIWRQDTRKAVLDAATAAELALSKIMDTKLAGLPSPVVATVLSATQGLSRLANALRGRFDVQLPAAINEKLGQPRNRTIHSGETPSLQAAMDAAEIAQEIVEIVHPRSSILDTY